jgi:hypothetical protein
MTTLGEYDDLSASMMLKLDDENLGESDDLSASVMPSQHKSGEKTKIKIVPKMKIKPAPILDKSDERIEYVLDMDGRENVTLFSNTVVKEPLANALRSYPIGEPLTNALRSYPIGEPRKMKILDFKAYGATLILKECSQYSADRLHQWIKFCNEVKDFSDPNGEVTLYF